MSHSKARRDSLKPANDWRSSWGLHPDYPLFPLPAAVDPGKPDHRRWCKKVRGKLEYFGKVSDDPKGEAALVEWLRVKDALISGRVRPPKDDGRLTLRDLCNKFLAGKRTDVDTGKLSPQTFVQYAKTTDRLIKEFGRDVAVADLGPADFEKLYAKMAKQHGMATIGREVTLSRSVFRYAIESDLIDRAVRFGPRFRQPSKADKRKDKAKQRQKYGAKLFTADDIRRMIDGAGPQLRAMLLLAINAGFGNSDCATLPLSALDLQGAWCSFPRPKTGVERRCKLWPETVEALRVVIANRQPARDAENDHLVFLTRLGGPWVRYGMAETKDEQGTLNVTGTADNAITKSTAKLLTKLGIKRPGLSFFSLRHTFASAAAGCKDEEATRYILGHVDGSMLAENVESAPADDRLRAVVSFVRKWLFPAPAKAKTTKTRTRAKKTAELESTTLRIVG